MSHPVYSLHASRSRRSFFFRFATDDRAISPNMPQIYVTLKLIAAASRSLRKTFRFSRSWHNVTLFAISSDRCVNILVLETLSVLAFVSSPQQCSRQHFSKTVFWSTIMCLLIKYPSHGSFLSALIRYYLTAPFIIHTWAAVWQFVLLWCLKSLAGT